MQQNRYCHSSHFWSLEGEKAVLLKFPSILKCSPKLSSVNWSYSLLHLIILVLYLLRVTITLHVYSSCPEGGFLGFFILSGNIPPPLPWDHQCHEMKIWGQLSLLVTNKKQAAFSPEATTVKIFPMEHHLSLKSRRTSWCVSCV